jgi:hypothetical protein
MAPIGRDHEGWNFPAHQYGFMRFGERHQLVPGALRVELGEDLGVAPAIFVVADADEPGPGRKLRKPGVTLRAPRAMEMRPGPL